MYREKAWPFSVKAIQSLLTYPTLLLALPNEHECVPIKLFMDTNTYILYNFMLQNLTI